MLDLIAVKELGETFLWFLTLGKSDVEQIRDELQDLLSHCSQTLKSLGELTESLYKIKPQEFTEESFLPIYFHCINNYTGPDAARRARSHCTDIQRDVARINFKLTKILRTEIGSWKSLDEAFKKVADADEDFLDQYEKDMSQVDKELTEIVNLLRLEYYPFKTAKSSQPKLVLSPQDGYWYNFYKNQLVTLWKSGQVWRCQSE